MLYATLSEEVNDLGRCLSCERVIRVEKITNYQNIIGGCSAEASESKGSGDGIYTWTKIFVHFQSVRKIHSRLLILTNKNSVKNQPILGL